MRPRIAGVVANVHMGLAHEGLMRTAVKCGIKIVELDGLVVFINRARTKIKVLDSSGTVMGYVKAKSGRLPMGAIQYLPQVFSEHGKIEFDVAIGTYLKKKLEERKASKDFEWKKGK